MGGAKRAGARFGSSVLWNTLGNVVYLAAQYVLQILITRMSGNYAAGLLGTAMTVTNITLSVANYGMRSFQISDLAGRYTDRTYLQSRWLTVAVAGLGTAVFAMAVSYSAEQRVAIALYTLTRLSEGYIDVWHGYLQKQDRMDLVGKLFGLRGLLTMGSFWLSYRLLQSLNGALAVVAAVNWLCVFLADVPPSRRAADLAATGGQNVRLLLWECAPLAVYSLLNSSVGSLVKLFVERILGTETFGAFNNVFAPVQLVQVGGMYIFAPFMMTFTRLWAAKDRRGFDRAIAVALGAVPVLWACGAAGAALLGTPVFVALYGEGIRPYTGVLMQPAVIAAVTNLLVSMLCYLLAMVRGMKGLLAGNIAGIIAAALLSTPLLRGLGITGAAWATVLSRAVQAAVCLAALLYYHRRHFSGETETETKTEAEPRE